MSILIIDVGSSSVRALLFDDNAALFPQAETRRTHQFQTTQDGGLTAHPETLRQLVEACLDEILQHPEANQIKAVGMASFVGNVVGLDKNSQPLTPLFTYADTRGAKQITNLEQFIDKRDTHQRTGCLLHTAYYPVRLAWFAQEYPDAWQTVIQWSDFGTYCYQTWFGREVPASYSVMSWSGLLNRANLDWDTQWLEILDLPREKLPDLAEFSQTQQGLGETYAQRWPQLANIPFYLALGDGAAANIGSGASDDRHVALTIGTTAAMRRISIEHLPPVPNGLWSYRVTAQQHLIGGATSEGGNIYQWVAENFKLASSPDLEKYLLNEPADSHGLTVLPLLAGERSPGFNPLASGAVLGLNLNINPQQILQAFLESVALRLALIAEQLDLSSDTQIMASGGALQKSTAWAQILANALHRPINLLAHDELTARGVAILVLSHCKQQSSQDFTVAVHATIQPQLANVERLATARQRQQALYAKLWS